MSHRTVLKLRVEKGQAPFPSWMAVGAVVASAAFPGARPATAGPVPAAAVLAEFAPRIPRAPWLLPGPGLADQAAPAAPPPQASMAEPRWAFDIPAGPLADVIAAFQRTTGIDVQRRLEAIDVVQSPGVVGTHTTAEALRLLLDGTGVSGFFESPSRIVLDLAAQRESIVVTARAETPISPKYVVPLRDVPQTIAVIPRHVMESQGVLTLSDALRNVPGITLQAGEGGGASNSAGDMFNLRGFNAADSVFVDGVRDSGLITRDTYNLEQVEVYMGPTGADVGRGTAAGYVNLQSKAPRAEAQHSALLSVGSAEQKRLTVDANQPLSLRSSSWLGKSALRINALWQEGGVPGRDVVQRESRAVAPSLALGLETSTRVTVGAQFMRQDNLPDYGVPGAAWLETPLAPTTVRAPRPVDQSNYYGSSTHDYDEASQNSGTLRVEHDLDARVTVRHQARYNETSREAIITTIQNVAAYSAATQSVTLARQGNERRNTVIANQTSLIGRFDTGLLRHAATAGVEITSETQLAPALGGLGTLSPKDLYEPDATAPVSGFAPARTGAFTRGGADTVAVYAFDTVDVGARWQFTGGLRWERYHARFEAVDAAGTTTTDLAAADSIVSGKAGVVFRLTRDANVYGAVGTTVTPPGTTNFTLNAQPNNQNNPNVRPQESVNYELGAKWDIAGGRLALNASAFRTENTNVIYTVDATAVPPIYNQDDAQLVRGVAVGVTGSVRPGWDVFANVGYLDTELRSQGAANDGNRLTLTPAFSGSLWTTWRLPFGLTVGGGLRHTDPVFVNAANTIRVPGYRLVDALVEYPLNSHLSLRVNVSNLTNETYIRNVNNNGGRYNPGTPRAVLATTTVKF